MSTAKSRFASQTMFSALAADSGGEESEEELVEETPESSPALEVASLPAQKMTKTAMKKAKKEARESKQKSRMEAQQKKEKVAPNGKHTEDTTSTSTPEPVEVEPKQSTEPPAPPAPIVEAKPDASTFPAPPKPAVELSVPQPQPPPKEPEPAPFKEKAPPKPTAAPMRAPEPKPEPVAPVVPQKENVKQDKLEAPNPAPTHAVAPPPSNDEKKKQAILTRTLWTFIMIGGFIGLLLLGHAYMIILVMLCQTLVYREVTALFSLKSSPKNDHSAGKRKDPWSKTLNWYFFAVTNYFLYGESIIYYFKHVVFSDAQLHAFATNHRIISFTLYTIGFVGFVTSLKKGYLKQQFGLFCWVHMSLLLIVVSSHFVVNNILEGLIWFWVPASLVICNDVFAYICGITLGRTPLIALSPKKTWEGFLGAFWCTMLFSLVWGAYFMRFNYMICPVHDLGVSAFSNVQCVPNPVFVWKEWQIPAPFTALISTALGRTITTIPYVPYFGHLLVMSSFASLVAPFGGFFASGFKRAFDIKDFGDSIPGHGGMTDRMDCQFLMGVFTYVYYSSLIRQNSVTVGSVLQTIVGGLTVDEQLELIADLTKYLEGVGVRVPC
ncbi:phosphatidate cytidylyltransferase [Marasmius sp. AFHP31]|nr:phosphatidate cytidylyltransferase [Marasmius sp. AFHP31]